MKYILFLCVAVLVIPGSVAKAATLCGKVTAISASDNGLGYDLTSDTNAVVKLYVYVYHSSNDDLNGLTIASVVTTAYTTHNRICADADENPDGQNNRRTARVSLAAH